MPRRAKITDSPATTRGPLPATEIAVSRETVRARGRSGFGRVNTNANRKGGGGATWSGVKPEYLVGVQIVTPPTTSGVKTMTDHGITLPRQHMATVTSEDEYLRAQARADAEARNLK